MPQKRKPKTKTGVSAITQMARYSKDQIISSVKSRYTGKSAPGNIARDISTIMSLLNTEEKTIDTLTTAVNLNSTAPLVQAIGTCAQGTTGSTRTGDSIKVCKMDVILNFNFASGTAATTAQQNQVFNWYLVRYLKSTSATPFPVNDFLNVDPNGNTTPLSLINNDLNQNFQVMASGQRVVQLQFASTATSANFSVVELSHPCAFHQTYTGSAANTIADGMCFLVFTALSPANAGGVSQVTSSVRTWFVDN